VTVSNHRQWHNKKRRGSLLMALSTWTNPLTVAIQKTGFTSESPITAYHRMNSIAIAQMLNPIIAKFGWNIKFAWQRRQVKNPDVYYKSSTQLKQTLKFGRHCNCLTRFTCHRISYSNSKQRMTKSDTYPFSKNDCKCAFLVNNGWQRRYVAIERRSECF